MPTTAHWKALWSIVAAGVLIILAAWFVLERRTQQDARPPILGTKTILPTDDPAVSSSSEKVEQSADPESPGDDERQGLRPSALEGKVTDDRGLPVVDAEVSWTPLEEVFFESAYVWGAVDWNELAGRSAFVRTDSEGRFAFEAGVEGGRGGATVLWITHASFEAQARLVDVADTPVSGVMVVQLETGPLVRVQVIDGAGRGVPGARIEQFGVRAPAEHRSSDRWLAAYRAFHRTITTEEKGFCPTALSSTQGSFGLVARASSQESRPWFSWLEPLIDPVQLQLTPTFVAHGTVAWPDNLKGERNGMVTTLAVTNAYVLVLTQSRVRSDGTWGPVPVSLLEVSRYIFRLESPGVAVQQRTLPSPAGGEVVRVDFTPDRGVNIPVVVRAPDGTPVAGADINLTTGEGGDDLAVQAYSDESGKALLRGIPVGMAAVSVTASGYPPARVGPFEVAMGKPEPLMVTLESTGTLQGRVVHGGEPLTEFEIAWWTSDLLDGQPPTVVRFADRADGSFSLEGLPRGIVGLLACSKDLPRSSAVSISTDTGQDAWIELTVPDPIPTGGRTVDANTGDPIAGAVLQQYTNDGASFVHAWNAPVTSRPDGTFELHGLAPGDNRLTVQARGYADRLLSVQAYDETAIELGPVPLFRGGELRVELTQAHDHSLSGYSASLVASRRYGERKFDQQGRVTFEDVAPGRAVLEVFSPDGVSEYHVLDLPPSESTTVRIDPSSGPTLTIEVQDAENNSATLEGSYLTLRDRGPLGLRTRSAYLPANGLASFVCRAASDVAVTMWDKQGSPLAAQSLHLGYDDQRLVLKLGANGATILVVDSNGSPVPGAEVHLYTEADSSGWTTFARTDRDGMVTFAGLPYEHCLAGAISNSIGMRFDVPVRTGPVTRPVRIELACSASLQLLLLEGEQPAQGVQVRAMGAGETYLVGYASSDDNGRVTFAGLAEGEYSVTIVHPGVFRSSVKASTRPRSDPFHIAIVPLGSLRLDAKGHDGTVSVNTRFDLIHASIPGSLATWIAEGRIDSPPAGLATNVQGRLEIHSLPVGHYRWQAIGSDGSESEGSLEVKAGAVTQTDVNLASGG
jgi:protocatechuate 3,4-dioxygenase beta subunit